MKITSVLRNILLEDSRFENLYTKFVEPQPSKDPSKPSKPKLKFDTLKQFIFADPTSKMPEEIDAEGLSLADIRNLGNKFKVGAYTQWLLKNFFKPTFQGDQASVDPSSPQYKELVKEFRRLYIEDLFKMNDVISKFERAKALIPAEQRDINQYTPETLTKLILNLPEDVKERIKTKDVKSQARQERKENRFAHPGAEIMKEGTNYTLIKIEGTGLPQQEAAQWYGGFYDWENGESHWCTSPPKSNYFMTYASAGPLYVIMANDDKGLVGARTGLPQERYQIHFPTSQYKDRLNSSIPFDDLLLTDFAELKDIFKTEYAKYLSSSFDPNKFIIEFPTSGYLGKYIKLYGFDEVYKNIPDTIKEFAIRNTGEAIPKIDISFIGRFKNLTEFSLENIDVVLPEATCELKNLSLISLQRIPTEQTLPECIANLPNLMTLNLEKSDSIIIPPRLLDKLSNVDGYPGFYFVV